MWSAQKIFAGNLGTCKWPDSYDPEQFKAKKKKIK